MPCSRLYPMSVCGANGNCVSDNTTAETFCKCSNGWSQSLELNYFNVDDNFSSGTCSHNERIIHGLYVISSVVAVLTLLAQLYLVRSWNKLKRVFLPLVCYMLACIASIQRSTNPDSLFGIDVSFSFTLSNAFGFQNFCMIALFDKYLRYLENKFEWNSEQGIKVRVNFARKLNYFGVIFDLINAQLLWTSSLPEDRRTGLQIIRASLVLFTLRTIYNVLLFSFIFSRVERDLKNILVARNSCGYVSLDSKQNQRFLNWISKKIPELQRLRRVILCYTPSIILFFPGSLWDLALQGLKYTFPLILIAYNVASLIFLRNSIARAMTKKSTSVKSTEDLPVTSGKETSSITTDRLSRTGNLEE